MKLFRTIEDDVRGIAPSPIAIEKSLQTLVERHLETFLGVRFLASEFSTSKAHGGRIDTVGIDQQNCPVIIEYKRGQNENVINQGLFYLNWLKEHHGDFQLLVMKRLDPTAAFTIDWENPRLICVAADFTKFDIHAVQQITQRIDLVRYRRFGDDLVLLESVAGQALAPQVGSKPTQNADTGVGKSVRP